MVVINFNLEPVRSVGKPKHKRKAAKRGERSKFSKKVRDELKEKFDNTCQSCGGRGHHAHHVMPRSRGGRGVITNALLLCNECHKKVHESDESLNYWIDHYRKLYGHNFYRDREDLRRIEWERVASETMDS